MSWNLIGYVVELYIVGKPIISSPRRLMICCYILKSHEWRQGQTRSSIKWRILESLQCREHHKVIEPVFLHNDYRQIIYCLNELCLWSRQVVVRRGAVRWNRLCGAAFKVGHRKLMNVTNCAIPQTLHNEVPQLGSVCRLLRILDVCKMRHCFPNILWNACLNHPTTSCWTRMAPKPHT